MKINLIPSITYVEEDELKGKTALIIDVLRATTVMTTALGNGAVEIIPVTEIDEALKLKDTVTILGGERKGLKIDGFDLANSPLDYTSKAVKGRRVVMTTTNGTRAIKKCMGANKLYIGCMLNAKAAAKRLTDDNMDTTIVCSGTNGKFSLDDFICAGKIIYEAEKSSKDVSLDDFASAAYMAYSDHKEDVLSYVKMAFHYNYLISIGLSDDVRYSFQEDTLNIVPEYKNGKISNAR